MDDWSYEATFAHPIPRNSKDFTKGSVLALFHRKENRQCSDLHGETAAEPGMEPRSSNPRLQL